jgi:hypothetical protein
LVLLLALTACGDSPATSDAAIDGTSDDADSTCQGQCRLTNVAATFNATRTLDSAYYGITFDTNNLHVEAYRRASTGCPTMSSPTPDYTLVLGEVSPTQSMSNLATANILDFKGDLLGGPLGVAATQVKVDRTAGADGMFIALDVDLTFQAGTVVGHIFAAHCASLDN